MLTNDMHRRSLNKRADYYTSRWKQDTRSSATCIILISGMLFIAILHDLVFSFSQGKGVFLSDITLFFSHVIGLVLSFAIIAWLTINKDTPKIMSYKRYVFMWELTIIFISFYADILRPQLSYLNATIEIPVIMFLYLLVPQHNHFLRILPPSIFSIGLTLIYYFHKIPPATVGFANLYAAIVFVNLVGIYFSNAMYLKDYRFYCLSNCDALTGLYNRRYFKRKSQEEWNHCYHHQKSISICLIDIDFFKYFNDTYGHLCGDQALKKVATTLKKSIEQPSDFVARYGGEEFIIILPNRTMEESKIVMETIRSSIERLKIPHHTSKTSAYLTLSIGVATVIPQGDMACNELIYQADMALYQAKLAGRNQIATKSLPNLP